ncbi:altered inheritance of mitochondria protein 3-like [Teleopsis dalmanni]|uniref:altered inheritance of mitochondria protein 3-like n=1 Tax=Teleopsis dalmanni TaxID=139649 RepID=UPI0018CD64A8|nr:altered inheritance of mitochondria protein 3-like [Teleopsis dalmanni]XP_037950522.1 altered inheritance of mitochondria protein 3-like [Teleopsis dalmanni]XP_037950584.1 altered inheritance of mitochondria protein 3-like [Teleopsis dalmanni]
MLKLLIVSCILATLNIAYAQHRDYTTPVPILKQIDRHNDDGSYTYGYEAADKSFKIETKYANGEVFGKYGFVDDQGQVREIEYGASKRGFEPAGSDINVPPPTLTSNNPYPLGPNEIDDGQYREDPAVYYKDQKFNRPIAASKFSLNNNNNNNYYQQPYQQPSYAPPPPPQPPRQEYRPQYYNPPPPPPPQPRYQPQPYQQSYQQPYHQPNYNSYNNGPTFHHPAIKNIDIWSGSYSVDYTGRK